MSKGNVKVESFRDRLRLRWTVAGESYSLSLRLDDTVLNRRIAEAKATQIQLDIMSNNFDSTLEKYKPQNKRQRKTTKVKALTFQELWEAYQTEREKDLAVRTIRDKFKSLQSRINQFGKDIKTQLDAEKFKEFLEQTNKPQQVLDKITSCSACYKWGIEQGLVEMNWFEKIKPQIKPEPLKEIQPFTTDEIRIILDGFQYPKYCHYFEYVQFLFLTGCRTSEAIGLKWKHINKDFSEIWIGESKTRGVSKSTKTNKARIFPCNNQLKKLLLDKFNSCVDLTDENFGDKYIFTAPSGQSIDDRNFSARYWKPCLESMNIDYRPQYLTRHTFISHALHNGMKPLEIAAITGHDVSVLYDRYAGLISRVNVPEMALNN